MLLLIFNSFFFVFLFTSNLFSSSSKYVENPDDFQSFFGKKPMLTQNISDIPKNQDNADQNPQIKIEDEVNQLYRDVFIQNITTLNQIFKEQIFSLELDFLQAQADFFAHLESMYSYFEANAANIPQPMQAKYTTQAPNDKDIIPILLNPFRTNDFLLNIVFDLKDKSLTLSIPSNKSPKIKENFFKDRLLKLNALKDLLKDANNLAKFNTFIQNFLTLDNWNSFYGPFFFTESLPKSINENWLKAIHSDLSKLQNLNFDKISSTFDNPKNRKDFYSAMLNKIFGVVFPPDTLLESFDNTLFSLKISWKDCTLKKLWSHFSKYMALHQSFSFPKSSIP